MPSEQSKLERRRARREQARRQRQSARTTERRPRTMLQVAIIAAVVALIVGLVAAVLVTQRQPPAAAAGRAVPLEADCNRPPPVTCPHLSSGERYTKYNSNPPASGPHWDQPAAWGVYDRPLPVEQLIHNLEHGGIVAYYSCRDCSELVEQLKDAVKGFKHTVLVPYYDMPHRIALTAWGYLDELDAFDRDRVLRFVRAHIDRGPERVP